MKAMVGVVVGFVLLAACSSAEWVHPNKHKDEFAQDYNKCQGKILRDPKFQQGNNYLTLQATEKCVMQEGWRLREKRE